MERGGRGPLVGPFLAEDGWWLTGDPAAERFCAGAFLVDDYESRYHPMLEPELLFVRARMPLALARLELVCCQADHDNLGSTFYVLEGAAGESTHWRCDVEWQAPRRRVYSIAAPWDDDMVARIRDFRWFSLVSASTWVAYEFIDAALTVSNVQSEWIRCAA